MVLQVNKVLQLKWSTYCRNIFLLMQVTHAPHAGDARPGTEKGVCSGQAWYIVLLAMLMVGNGALMLSVCVRCMRCTILTKRVVCGQS